MGSSKRRPDLSCVVDDIALLNSECKPEHVTKLKKKKDYVKVQLTAKQAINQQLQNKGGPGKAVLLTVMGM